MATTSPAPSTVEDQFLDLICSDPDLLGLEFDAIIAEEWPAPPARTPGRGALARPDRGPVHATLDRIAVPGARAPRPRVRRWARQRSPPCG